MNNIPIVVCDKFETVVFRFDSPVVPRKGELINLPHRGTYRIDEIAYRLADDSLNYIKSDELLICVELIVDFNNQIKDI